MFYKIMFKSLLTLITFVTTALSCCILVGITEDDIAQNKPLIRYWWIFFILYGAILIFHCVWYEIESRTKKNSSINIHNFSHSLRNYIVENTSSKMICNAYEFRTNCNLLCQEICEFIKREYNKKEVSVSIKLLNPWTTKQDEESVLETEVKTLCCVGYDYRANANNRKEKVSDYTAFKDILLRSKNFKKQEKSTYACSNLYFMIKKAWPILDSEPYRGCSEDCKSTVVVPIRVNLDSIDIDKKECYKGYKTFGFICIECKQTCSKATIGKITDYLCSFADYLCVYFSNAYEMNFYSEYSKNDMATV